MGTIKKSGFKTRGKLLSDAKNRLISQRRFKPTPNYPADSEGKGGAAGGRKAAGPS